MKNKAMPILLLLPMALLSSCDHGLWGANDEMVIDASDYEKNYETKDYQGIILTYSESEMVITDEGRALSAYIQLDRVAYESAYRLYAERFVATSEGERYECKSIETGLILSEDGYTFLSSGKQDSITFAASNEERFISLLFDEELLDRECSFTYGDKTIRFGDLEYTAGATNSFDTKIRLISETEETKAFNCAQSEIVTNCAIIEPLVWRSVEIPAGGTEYLTVGHAMEVAVPGSAEPLAATDDGRFSYSKGNGGTPLNAIQQGSREPERTDDLCYFMKDGKSVFKAHIPEGRMMDLFIDPKLSCWLGDNDRSVYYYETGFYVHPEFTPLDMLGHEFVTIRIQDGLTVGYGHRTAPPFTGFAISYEPFEMPS